MLTLAAEGSGSPLAFEWMPALTTVVVFIIFFLILRAKVWPQITKGLDDRQQKILEEIEAAEQARQKADEARSSYEQELTAARKEATEMIAQARSDAKKAADDLRARNQQELTEMKDRATRDIEAAKRSAITELHAEAASLAASIASKILQREISSDDQQRLVDESLQELTRAGEA